MRLKECDTDVCLQGATERIGKGRYDLPWLETELDPEIKQFIEEFSKKTLQYIYELLDKYKSEKQIIIFKSREDADDYINKYFMSA